MAYQKQPLFSIKSRSRLKRVMPKSIYSKYFGRHERLSLNIWKLLSARVTSDFSILDIGAFHGEFALLARSVNRSSEISAFEPNPESLEILRSNCQSHQINVIEKAISDENGEVYFHCDSQISAMTSKELSRSMPGPDTITIDAITLDSLTKASSKPPRLIKIDVEDAADKVLRGARFLLKAHRPVLICEILNDQIGNDVMESLTSDYGFFYINENLGLEKKISVKRYDWRYKNWLFVPIEDKASLELLRSKKVLIKEVS